MVAVAAAFVSCSEKESDNSDVGSKSFIGTWRETRYVIYEKKDGEWIVTEDVEISYDDSALITFGIIPLRLVC